jgi:hypothetical protein
MIGLGVLIAADRFGGLVVLIIAGGRLFLRSSIRSLFGLGLGGRGRARRRCLLRTARARIEQALDRCRCLAFR